MADGRHFENSFILISQSELSDFDQIWYADANFHSEDGDLTNIDILQIQDGGRTPYWKCFLLYLGEILADLCEIWNGDEESHADIGHVTKMAIFENSRWRTASILKIALSPYLSRELSDFDQIWYADANFHSEDGLLTQNRNFANSRWRTDAILKIVFCLYWPINAKFGPEMKNHMQI